MCQTKGFALSAIFDEKCAAVRSKSEISLRENTGTPPRVYVGLHHRAVVRSADSTALY